jgi:hypothetical protein
MRQVKDPNLPDEVTGDRASRVRGTRLLENDGIHRIAASEVLQ